LKIYLIQKINIQVSIEKITIEKLELNI